jgi:hypothetical protein
MIPHYILKYKGQYFTGYIGWSGISTSKYRADSSTYQFSGVKELINMYPDVDFEVIKIELEEYDALKAIQRLRRQSKQAVRQYNLNVMLEKY